MMSFRRMHRVGVGWGGLGSIADGVDAGCILYMYP
jgi:hypothetical protein